jgi:hypothetical protein
MNWKKEGKKTRGERAEDEVNPEERLHIYIIIIIKEEPSSKP